MNPETKRGYDPDRIPPSVFATTMTPKQEWSIQSNESLFSIHMGDQNFTNMYKSGELSNFDYNASPYINNNNTNDNKIPLSDAGTKTPNVEISTRTANPDGLFIVSKPDTPPQVPISPTNSSRSATSNNSAASFAFPTLPEHQQDQKTQFNGNTGTGNKELSRSDSKPSLYPEDPKLVGGGGGGGGGWLSCLFCFSVKN